MATDMTASVTNLQVFEVGINGPGRAKRLILITGQIPINLNANANAGQNQNPRLTVFAKVGPELTAEQFIRATASAAATQWQCNGAAQAVQWSIDDVDAHYDDESSHVHVEVESSVLVYAGTTPAGASLLRASFSVQIVATD